MIESAVHWLLSYLAIPEVGLTSVFLISFISATLLPLGSEPAVFAVVAADKSLFWQVMAVAAAGNTLGGILNYWIGFGAKKAFAKERETRWFGWLEKYGAKTMLLGWMPRNLRSALHVGGLAEIAVLAVCRLYGYRQAGALCADDLVAFAYSRQFMA